MEVALSTKLGFLMFVALMVIAKNRVFVEGASWCVARSDASNQALQTALDYACGAGADCTPLQTNGLCFLPNTIQAHASYAYNSYYQRRGMAPGSCDFAGTATVAKTDPSYGSCVYPSSQSTAGGMNTPSTTPTTATNNPSTSTTPTTNATPFSSDGNNGVNPGNGISPPIPTTDNSKAPVQHMGGKGLMPFMLLLTLSITLQPIFML